MMNKNLIKFQLGDLGVYFDNVVELHKLFLVLGITEYPEYSLISNAAYYQDGELKITSEFIVPKDEVVHINEILEQEEVDKLIHSLTNKEKFFKGLATVNLTEEELESVLLKYKFEVETYVEDSLAPEILDLILINGTLHSFYKKLENITYLDLF
uniref:Uncharacterized protein n=1 Tax=Siphoviridae sp. ctHip2 TaxID=2827830 RepID=A0A8S5RVW8_9CAUD|nr:MAG TPA: hypothetical protein [Siphoviridae sp. ctHip2]